MCECTSVRTNCLAQKKSIRNVPWLKNVNGVRTLGERVCGNECDCVWLCRCPDVFMYASGFVWMFFFFFFSFWHENTWTAVGFSGCCLRYALNIANGAVILFRNFLIHLLLSPNPVIKYICSKPPSSAKVHQMNFEVNLCAAHTKKSICTVRLMSVKNEWRKFDGWESKFTGSYLWPLAIDTSTRTTSF